MRDVDVGQLYSSDRDVEITWNRRGREGVVETLALLELVQEVAVRSPQERLRIADVGGGNGFVASLLAQKGHEVLLSDLSGALIEDARRRLAGCRGVSSIDLADAASLPYADDSVDLVVLFGPLYHSRSDESRRAILLESSRILAPGGTMLCEFFPVEAAYRLVAADRELPLGSLDGVDGTGRLQTGDAFLDSLWFCTPEEVVDLIQGASLNFVDLVPLDAPLPDSVTMWAAHRDSSAAHRLCSISLSMRGAKRCTSGNHIAAIARSDW